MKENLRGIRLLLLDVDGVLTDGRIIYDANGVESKCFDVKDGHGIKMLQRAGIRVGIITGRQSPVVLLRARELGIDLVIQGAKQKLPPYETILREQGLADHQVAYVGDDLIDLPILRRVGFAATVADGVEEMREHVDYVTRCSGGRGAVREICDMLLRETGLWQTSVARYYENSD